MREIKFSYLFQHDETGRITERLFTLEDIEQRKLEKFCEEMRRWDIISRRQFTGLLDKNGKEIYDGDWLGIPSHKSKVNYNIRRGALCMGWERLTAYKASKLEIVRDNELLTK